MTLNSTLQGITNDVAFYRHEAESAKAVGDMATVEEMQEEEARTMAILSPSEQKLVILYLETSF